ncbi:MAG: anthranilate phosphoribosyltransferase [Deltaproteobacteria bacterium CG1_02_45_11]|nr:MAG: anthranilate phosphoribosyltransferase [Deltaproteobacteria bacterium CG1_02_45_11]
MIKEITQKIEKKADLSENIMIDVFEEIMTGRCADDEIAAFLSALKAKGETIEEIAGAAIVMRRHVTAIHYRKEGVVLDTCGTGGDAAGTFNISTISAFVASAAGIAVAKHGNRAVSSKCGSADLLQGLGVNIEADKELVEDCLNGIGIGFMFAPMLHPAMKYAMPARKMLNTRTIFNILGPLTNPAGAACQLLGVYDVSLTDVLASVLKRLGTKRAFVVHGLDGLDEITTTARTKVSELKDGLIRSYEISPEEFGVLRVDPDELKGGDIGQNVSIAIDILSGKKGAKREAVVLNAGCAIYIAGIVKNIPDGIELAKKSIDSGQAGQKLENLKKMTNRKVSLE